MKNPYIYLGMLLILLSSCQHTAEEEEEQQEAEKRSLNVDSLLKNPKIKIGKLEKRELQEELELTGRIIVSPDREHAIHSKIEGYIEQIYAFPGDYVPKGRLLMTISNIQLIEKQKNFLETKAKLKLATQDYERKLALSKQDATSSKILQEVEANKELLEAQYLGLKTELSLLGIHVKKLEEEQSFQSHLTIVAEQSGYISDMGVVKGQYIDGKTQLLKLTNQSDLRLRLNVLPYAVDLLEKGSEVEFRLANSDKIFKTKIDKIEVGVDPETGTLSAYGQILKNNDNKDLKVGSFVQARLKAGPKKLQGLPIEAVVKSGEDYFAYLVKGKAVEKVRLDQARVVGDFISFNYSKTDADWVVRGAYYLE
jgi:cobalt-zinc-cadmium efflux system membrane fusion protein